MAESLSPENRRGLFSCLHSKCDDAPNSGKGITEALHDLIADLYLEAFGRLHFDAMDTDALRKAMVNGGHCVGLLDPVSNIILNTISVLPRDFRPKPPSSRYNLRGRPKRKRPAGAAWPDYTWYRITRLSCHSLVVFLVRYFGCLTDEQAARYLHWARADLALAVLLVEHDLYAAAEPQLPDPASPRTQAALKCAAISAYHPAPSVLVRLHTSPLPQQRLLAAAPFLKPGGRNLTLDDVNAVTESMRYQETASLDLQVNVLPDGRGVVIYYRDFAADEGTVICNTSSVNGDGGSFRVFTITVERHGDPLASLRGNTFSISTFLENASQGRSSLKICGDACEYTESLNMRLQGMIHALYLRAFTMLPSDASRWLVRYILFAGHCYGPMDPVSNIIINSIWHSMVFPLPSSDDSESQAYDILDTLSMLRVEVRSLKGLIALVKASSDCSKQRAMEHLCSNSCRLSQDMSTPPHGFHTAAEAAQHPQHAALGSFLSSLTPHMLDNLRSLLSNTNGTLSSESLDLVKRILAKGVGETVLAPKDAELCQVAKDALLKKRSEYENSRLFIRSEIAKALKKYACEHPQEPKYVPSVICGVVETYNSDWDSYHVNFVAASESGADNQLFFAELNVTGDQSKPNFCCHLCLTHTGRWYCGPSSSIKIVYPASSDYFDRDITMYGIEKTYEMLDADFVFDFRRDGQFAEDVAKYCEDQKALAELDAF